MKFGYPATLIREYNHWVVLLRPNQVTVGSMVLAAKSSAAHLGELLPEEWAEFAKVCADVENITSRVFGAEKFNYLALMMVDQNVHFHFVPRYSRSVNVGGVEYSDKDWPMKTELGELALAEGDLEQIKQRIMSAI